MVSIIGSNEYYETNLDDEIFRPKVEKVLYCYRHIHGAQTLTCGFQSTDEYLFGKHREWFCKFRADRCMRKCIDCTKLYENCIETEECKEDGEEDQEEEKRDKIKSFFSMFSKKYENKEESLKNESLGEENSQIGEESEQKNTDESKKVAKKSFFSIFGHDAEEFVESKTEKDEENDPKSVEGSVHEDQTSKHEAEEIKPTKKKLFFSKKTKEKEVEHDISTAKWHDGTSDDELEEVKPKKKSSFFSKFSKKDLTKDSDREDEKPTEQNSVHVSDSEEETKDQEEESKKETKKKFFSKSSKTNHPEEEQTTLSTATSVDTIDMIENEDQNQNDEPKKKKSFFNLFKKDKDDSKSLDSENTHEETVETAEGTPEPTKKEKKKTFFRFKKDSESKSVDNEDNFQEIDLESNISTVENSPEPQNKKKKTFLVRQNKKENSTIENEEQLVEEQTNIMKKKTFLVRQNKKELPEEQQEDDTKKPKKKFLVRNKKDEEENKSELAETVINGDENEDITVEKEKNKKKSFFSKSKKNEEEPILEHQESVEKIEIHDDKSETSLDVKPKEEKKKKSFFSRFKKEHNTEETQVPQEAEEIVNNEDLQLPVEEQNGLPEVIQLSEDGIILEPPAPFSGEEITTEEPKPKRERRKSFLEIFTKKDGSEIAENDELAETRSLDGSKKLSKRKSRENLHEEKKKSKSKLDLSKKHEDETYKKKYFEECKICFPIFKACPNDCYDCYRRISEYNWFDHCILRHAIPMDTKVHENETIAYFLQAEFNKKMYFWFSAYDFTFYFEFIFSLGSIIINMTTNMEEYACRYFKCEYIVSWLDSNFTENLSFLGQEFWDWNVHTILADKAVDDKFFDKCKLIIKVSRF